MPFISINKSFININKSFININKSFININKSFINIDKSFININKCPFCPLWPSIILLLYCYFFSVQNIEMINGS